MYASRYEELNKIMNIMDELNGVLSLIKKNINYSNETKSSKILNSIESKIKENIKSIKQLEDPFLLFIMGSGNYGKSTLINALLRQDIVKTADLPNTWKLDLFVKDDNEKMEIIYNNNKSIIRSLKSGNELLKKESQKFKLSKSKVSKNVSNYKKINNVSINELKEYKKQQEEIHLYKSDIVQIKYHLNKGNILNDFIIVDTPGLNQTLLKNTLDRMKEYYIKADGVIWIIDAQNIVSKETNNLIEEKNRIDSLHKGKKNMIAVVNKMDIISKCGKENILKIREKTNEIYKDKFDDIVYISAKEAMDGIINKDDELIYKSSINVLYKSIEENFTKICEEKQIDSKYKNLYIMKENILKEIHDYKRELYKDMSIYNQIDFELKQKIKEIYNYTLSYIENIKNKNIYSLEDINNLKKDIEKLQIQCSLDLMNVYEVLINKLNINNYKEIRIINTNVYFSRSKNLILDYYKCDTLYEENKSTSQLESIFKKLTLKNSKQKDRQEVLITKHIYKKISNLKEEILKILEEKMDFIQISIIEARDKNFKDKYLEYEKVKEHIRYLNDIENILNKLG